MSTSSASVPASTELDDHLSPHPLLNTDLEEESLTTTLLPPSCAHSSPPPSSAQSVWSCRLCVLLALLLLSAVALSALLTAAALGQPLALRQRPQLRSSGASPICVSPFPPSDYVGSAPLVEHWRLCPLPHSFPARSPSAPPLSANPTASLSSITSAYPRIFLLDPSRAVVYVIAVYEAGYDAGKGRWTAVCIVYQVDAVDGDWRFSGEVEALPMVDSAFLHSVARFLVCSDSVTGISSPAEMTLSYHFVHLHCPFAGRPHAPQHQLQYSQQQASSAHNLSSLSSYPQRAELRFHHPLFAAAQLSASNGWQMKPVVEQLHRLTELMRKDGTEEDWLQLQTLPRFPPPSTLSLNVCLACVPPVDVTHCTAPLLNDRYVDQVHSQIQYHTALGVQRFVVYDRWGEYEEVLSPYIQSGLVEYIPVPLPFRNALEANAVPNSNEFFHWRNYFDQETALEACRLRNVGSTSWLLYKDFDEWITFPRNSSFIRENRVARCFSADWRPSPPALQRVTGSEKYVHVTVAVPAPQAGNRSESVFDKPTSLYSHYTHNSTEIFMLKHQSDGGLYREHECASPLLAYLTAVTDVRLLQQVTHVPFSALPTAHRSTDGLLPAALPCDSTADGTTILLSQHLKEAYRWQWIGVCDVNMIGPEETDFSGRAGSANSSITRPSLMLDRWLQQAPFSPRRQQRQKLKWFARPTVGTLFNHFVADMDRIHRAGPGFSQEAIRQNSPDMRPCDEVHFKHFKNFPTVRESVDPNASYEVDKQLAEYHHRLIDTAEQR